MKKIIVAMTILFAAGISTGASAQQTQQTQQTQPAQTSQTIKYYYYPSSNVYYNESTGEYLYYNDADASWTTVKTLPSTIVLEQTPRYEIQYNGTDVWKDNAEHIKKYKVKKDGEVKAKPKKDGE
jgi:hypothetical protein